jgi:hypothetical protein
MKEIAVGMSLSGQELLPEETGILEKNANALVRPDELGLSRFAFDHALGAAGLRGTEAIGGKLHLTTYRLVFKSHAANRAKGEFSIFLPTIREVRNTSSGLKRQLEIATAGQRFTFVVWGAPALITAIEQAKAGLDRPAVLRLAEMAGARSGLLGEGLLTAAAIEAVNKVLARFTHPIAGSTPVEPDGSALSGLSQAGLSTALNLAELLQGAAADA